MNYSTYNYEYQKWLLCKDMTDEEKDELFAIVADDNTKKLRFSASMDFGTAGLRSTMYMGTACMNRFTVAQTTRGIAALVKKAGGEKRGVAIAFDSRNHSEEFARVSASILASEGIKVYIFDSLRPTPELSYAVRHFGALAGINITASHNPKEYNGYKAYWEDGAQINPDQAKIVSAEREKFDVLDMKGADFYDEGVASGIITVLDESFDEHYIKAVMNTAINADLVKEAEDLKVVYTPLHGAGYKLVPEVFLRMGLKNLYTVESQMTPDGDFPTVEKPNPEYANVFTDGIKIANEVGSDIVIATDPDSDRVGVMARAEDGEFKTITGNQMGALLLDYVIGQKRALGTLKENAFAVKSIVSTDMAYKIAEVQGVKLYDVYTGFKFIGEVIKEYEAKAEDDAFLLGFEESYGYLLGSYARDKDAVEASMLILEMTAYYKKNNMTLIDALNKLYETYGFYGERTIDIYMEGLDGIERRKRVMQSLRDSIPEQFGGIKVIEARDYKAGEIKNVYDGTVEPTGLQPSDVLYYVLENGDKIVVRPSGTEPKIKIYLLAHADDKNALDEKIEAYASDAKSIAEV
ncbi:MAG: phospho-sugar mutase [Ruminococcaceae bacterium]|nr:phospho-sugar mutase [Oscillospiraceae bacterium]